ncbi:MAG TPA: S8 family serine peptidase [Caulobacteraceae bacterium]
MSTFRLRGLAAALALLIASAGVSRAAPLQVQRPPPTDEGRQVLVMLRMAPQHFRPDAGYSGAYGDVQGRSARWRVAARLAHEQGGDLVNEWPMPILGVDCFVVKVRAGDTPEALSSRLTRAPDVAWSEPLHIYHGKGDPPAHNDPLYRVQPAAREWRLAELHRISTGRNVRVAVVDSMIDASQPDLAGQIELEENFVASRPAGPENHGTGVAGIIVARADNGVGIAGVAPQARVLGLRACWQETGAPAGSAATDCDSLSLAKALEFAIGHGAQIVNMSLSGPPDLLLARLLDVALMHRIVVVAAYDRGAPDGGFPASYRGVVAVADEADGPPLPGVFTAPGHDIPTTEPGGRWFLVNGSSYAAAHVSGLFALLRQRGPITRGPLELVAVRESNTVDACATLLHASAACDCGCALRRETIATK